MKLDLSGKTALVCGASKGIGKATALELASLGCRVVALARQEDLLKDLLKNLGNQLDHKMLVADLSNTTELKQKISHLTQTLGPVHIVVNNAGGPKGGPIEGAAAEEFEAAFKTHIVAASTIAQALLPGMKQHGYGRFINVISTSVKIPIANLGVSNTIRGAMASWAKTLANEVAAHGITVNNVLPGYTKTERLKALVETTAQKDGVTTLQVEQNWLKTIPASRFAEPSEIAAVVAFLASPAAAYVNGINVPVDGGRTGCL